MYKRFHFRIMETDFFFFTPSCTGFDCTHIPLKYIFQQLLNTIQIFPDDIFWDQLHLPSPVWLNLICFRQRPKIHSKHIEFSYLNFVIYLHIKASTLTKQTWLTYFSKQKCATKAQRHLTGVWGIIYQMSNLNISIAWSLWYHAV